MFKRIAKIFLFLLVGFLLSGFSFKDLTNPIYDNIKEQADSALKDLFHRDVTIREVSGRVIGQIVLKGVQITPELKAEIVKINFNPLKFAKNGGDIVPAITSIDIEQANATITRDKNNNVDIVQLFVDPNAKNDSPPEIPIKAKIKIKKSKIKYIDHLGIYDFKEDAPYKFDFFVESGILDLNKAPKLIFKVNAQQDKSTASASGWFNIVNQKYKINIKAKNLSAKTWGPFSIPLELSSFYGQADLRLEVSENKLKIDTKGKINDSTIKVNGTLDDFINPKLDFAIRASNAPLKEIEYVFKDIKNQDIKGLANANIKISGLAENASYIIDVESAKGLYFNQPFTAKGRLIYKDDLLTFSKANLKAYDGNLNVRGKIDFKNIIPKLDLEITPSKLNLYKLTQRSPGISGLGSGILFIKGDSKNFVGRLGARLTNANVLGQAVSRANGTFTYDHGNIFIKQFGVYSESGHIKGSGSILKNLETTLSTEAKGLLISGDNFVGKMQAFVKSFYGNLSFRLDQEFAKAPIRNLTASGSIEVERAKIAEQEIDYGYGKISIASGQINIPRFVIKKNESTLYLFGKTGTNVESDLIITGKRINLENLKIINLVLPPDLKNPKGLLDMDFKITGFLKSEAKLASFLPFLDLTYNGNIKISGAEIQGIKINLAQAEIKLKERKLNVKNAKAFGNKSILELNIDSNNEKLELVAKGKIDFSDFSPYLIQFGDFKGKGNFGLSYKKQHGQKNPEASFDLNLNGFSFENIFLGNLKTEVLLSDGLLSFNQPLRIESKQSKYELGGTALLEDEKINLYFKTHKAELKEIMPIGMKIFNIIGSKIKTTSKTSQSSKIVLPNILAYFKNGDIVLYDDKEKNYLSSWEAVVLELKMLSEEIPDFWKEFSGKLRGEIKINGDLKKPRLSFAARLDKTYYKKYNLNTIEIQGNYANNIVNIVKAQIIKAGGFFEVAGKYDTNSESTNLTFRALNMPADLLELIGENKKEYKGKFNLNGYLKGSIKEPTTSISLKAKDVVLAGIKYRKIEGRASLKENRINIPKLTLTTGKDISSLSGNYSLKTNVIKLDLVLNGKGLGIINILNDEVAFQQGDAKVKLKISGKLNAPSISGFLNLSEAKIKLNKLDSELTKFNANLTANNHNITLKKLTTNWIGKATKHRNNSISITGIADLSANTINLTAADTNLILDLNNFSGEIFTKKIRLAGPINNLLLSGKADFKDGVINLSNQVAGKEGAKKKTFPINLGLELNFGKNMYISSGNLETLDLSNLFVSLEFSGKEIAVSGNSLKPQLSGRLNFKRGEINIFNRDFDLLPESSQKKYYPYEFDKLSPNYALFSKEYGQFPYLNLTGDIIVEDTQTKSDASDTTATEIEKQKVYIVTRIRGVLGSKDPALALTTNFEAFQEDKSTHPPLMSKASYSDTEIKILLLPEFVKAVVGISKEEIKSSDVLADYLDSRLQVIVFRDVERQLEKALGLESLTLQYNFGKDIRHNLGKTGSPGIQPLFGIGFVKGFFDRLFISLKYSQFEQESVQNDEYESFNYEITYKLSPSLSIAYFEEPLTYGEADSGYYKVTLNNTVRF